MIANNNRYNLLLERDNTHKSDVERQAMFYIFSNNEDLYSKINHIYDFSNRSILPECLEDNTIDLCSSSRRLIMLAFNHFNGYPADVNDTLSILDESNFKIALTSMMIRFQKSL